MGTERAAGAVVGARVRERPRHLAAAGRSRRGRSGGNAGMSVRVTSWVWEHSQATGWERLVLLAIADEANDAGYLSGVEFGSVRRLSDKAKVNRKTVMRYVMALESIGELLVCRPEVRGHG